MKNKSLKLFCIALFGATGFYLFKNWEMYQDKSNLDVGAINLSQSKFTINEIKSSTPNPIWFIKTENPIVTFNITFKNEGGRSFRNTPCILNVVTSTLLEGAGPHDEVALKKIFSDNSISLNINSDDDNVTVNVHALSKHFKLVVNLLCDILEKAHLKKEKIDIAKQGIVVSLNQSKFSPVSLASDALNQAIYPKGHPYRVSIDEELQKVPGYTKKDVDSCYDSIFSPKDAVITIVGNVDEKDISESFEKLFKCLSSKKNNFKDEKQRTEIDHPSKITHVEVNNAQSSIAFALPGMAKTSAERFAAKFAINVFGDLSFASRLLKSVREKNGLVYYIYNSLVEEDMQSYVSGSAASRPENVDKVIDKIKEECAKLYENGITKEELTAFKTSIFAGNVLDTTQAVLSFIDSCRHNNIRLKSVNNYLNNYYNLNIEDVNAAIKKIFNPKNLVFVTAGKSLQKKEASNEKTH